MSRCEIRVHLQCPEIQGHSLIDVTLLPFDVSQVVETVCMCVTHTESCEVTCFCFLYLATVVWNVFIGIDTVKSGFTPNKILKGKKSSKKIDFEFYEIFEILESEKVSKFGTFRANLFEFSGSKKSHFLVETKIFR